MPVKRKKRSRRSKRDALVFQHLENVSRELFEQHPDIVRQFIGRNAGVYALYRRQKLYYVGLATGLRGRLNAHIKNRHSNSWDRFSIYLTINDKHLREIEALLLRIANPPGAKQRGKLAQSREMRQWMSKAVHQKRKEEISSLFGRLPAVEKVSTRSNNGDSELVRLLPEGARLRGTNKDKVYRARVRRNGTVRYNGKTYNSLTLAAKDAINRPTNGWWFWQIERGRGNWVRLNKIRKAGTPIYFR